VGLSGFPSPPEDLPFSHTTRDGIKDTVPQSFRRFIGLRCVSCNIGRTCGLLESFSAKKQCVKNFRLLLIKWRWYVTTVTYKVAPMCISCKCSMTTDFVYFIVTKTAYFNHSQKMPLATYADIDTQYNIQNYKSSKKQIRYCILSPYLAKKENIVAAIFRNKRVFSLIALICRKICWCDADVDECAVNNGGCGSHAHCTNTPGTFTCTCMEGYLSDGIICSGNCLQRNRLCIFTINIVTGTLMKTAADKSIELWSHLMLNIHPTQHMQHCRFENLPNLVNTWQNRLNELHGLYIYRKSRDQKKVAFSRII